MNKPCQHIFCRHAWRNCRAERNAHRRRQSPSPSQRVSLPRARIDMRSLIRQHRSPRSARLAKLGELGCVDRQFHLNHRRRVLTPARSETFAPKRAPAMGEVVEKDILERGRRIPRRKNSDVDEMKQKKPVAPASVASDRDGSSHQEAFRDRIKSRQRRSEKTCKSGRNSFVVCSQMPNQQQRKMTQTRLLNHHPRNLSIKLFSKNPARRTMLMMAVIVSRDPLSYQL